MNETIQDNSLLLSLRLSKPGNRRKAPTGMVEVDADRDAITVSKELLDCEELAAVGALDGAIRRYVYSRSLPSGILREGVYRLPLVLVDEVDNALLDFRSQREGLVEAFMVVYPTKVEQARTRLRSLYDPRDYPAAEALREMFGMEWRYIAIDVPRTLSASLVARERSKAAEGVASEMEEIRLALRTAFAELVQHAAERLAPGTGGKPKTFRDSIMKNLEDFLAYFHARDLTHDQELTEMVQRARSVIHGVTPQALRDQDALRQHVHRTMANIKEAMDEGAMLKPTRRFTLVPEAATKA